MNSRGINSDTEPVLHLCGVSSDPTANSNDLDNISSFSLMNGQDYNIRIKPSIKPMEEPSSGLSNLFLPPAMTEAFTLDDNDFDLNDDSNTKALDDEKNEESPCKLHQGIIKMKVLAPKGPKFSIKKHLRTYYYNKRR